MKKVLFRALPALIACLMLPVNAAERPSLPANVPALVEVTDLAQAEQKLQNLLRRLVPGAPFSSLRTALSGPARTDDPSVLDLSAPLLLVTCRDGDVAAPVFTFGVLDADRYLDALPQNLHGGETDGNLHLYEEDPLNAFDENVWDAGPARPLAIMIVDDRVVLGRNPDGVRAVGSLVADGTLAGKSFFPQADAGVAVRIRDLVGALDEQGRNPFEMLRGEIDRAAVHLPRQAQVNLDMGRMAIATVEAAATQVEVVEATLTLAPDAIVVTKSVQPVVGSALAAHLTTVEGRALDFMGSLPAGAVAVFAAHVGDPAPTLDLYMRLLSALAGSDESAAESLARIREKVTEMLAVMDGRLATAIAVSPQGFLVPVNVAGVKDAARAQEVFQSLLPLVEDVARQARTGVTTRVAMTPDAAMHAGHTIAEWDYDLQFEETGQPEAAQAVAMQREMMAAMMGPDLRAYSAFVDEAWMVWQGSGALDGLKAALDGSLSSLAGRPEFKAAMAGMPAEPAVVGYVDLGGLIGAYVRALASAMENAGMPFLPFGRNLRFAPAPGVGLAAAVDDAGRLQARLVVPVEALSSLVNGFMQAFMAGPPARLP